MTDSSQPTGVYAAALTPMTADLAPDLERVVAHNRWLLANGCDGVAPLGTTGEANSALKRSRKKTKSCAVLTKY